MEVMERQPDLFQVVGGLCAGRGLAHFLDGGQQEGE